MDSAEVTRLLTTSIPSLPGGKQVYTPLKRQSCVFNIPAGFPSACLWTQGLCVPHIHMREKHDTMSVFSHFLSRPSFPFYLTLSSPSIVPLIFSYPTYWYERRHDVRLPVQSILLDGMICSTIHVSCKWYYFSVLYGGIKPHCMYLAHFLYPIICWWVSWMVPCFRWCE